MKPSEDVMTKTTIIDQLPFKERVRKQVADIAAAEQRSEAEVVAELVENSLPDEDYVLEAAREGDAAVEAGGMGASNHEVLRWLAEVATGNRDAKRPERTIPY